FDMRARAALRHPAPVATNLGFVFITEESIKRVWDGSVGLHFGLLWPRQVYGRLVSELSEQGAKAVAFDIILSELRTDYPDVEIANGGFTNSDVLFAMDCRRAGNVILAVTPDKSLPPLFVT